MTDKFNEEYNCRTENLRENLKFQRIEKIQELNIFNIFHSVLVIQYLRYVTNSNTM
jgi:hypothetical protein